MFMKRLLPMLRPVIARRIVSAIFLAVFLLALAAPQISWAQSALPDTGQPDQLGLTDAQQIGLGQADLKTIISRVVQIALGFLGLVTVIIILYGGFIWMTSQGDAAKVEKAKKILTNAIIGLIIILSAYMIVAFIFRNAGGGGDGPGTGTGTTPTYPNWGIGHGPIESVFPSPLATDVPINTWIAVTFKENVIPNSICNTTGTFCNGEPIKDTNKIKHVSICQVSSANFQDGAACVTEGFTEAFFENSVVFNRDGDNRTFVFYPKKSLENGDTQQLYLGSVDAVKRIFQVTLKADILRVADGKSIFSDYKVKQGYAWQFETNGKLDLDPPEIVSTNVVLNNQGQFDGNNISGVYPNPDSQADSYGAAGAPTQGEAQITFSGQPQFEMPPTINNTMFVGQMIESKLEYVEGQGSGADLKARTTAGFALPSGASSGTVEFRVDSGATTVTFTQGVALLGLSNATKPITNNTVDTGMGITIVGVFPQASTWKFNVAQQKGEMLVLANGADKFNFLFATSAYSSATITKTDPATKATTVYYVVPVGATKEATAASLVNVLNRNSNVNNLISASTVGAVAKIQAKQSGTNSLTLTKATNYGAYASLTGSLKGTNATDIQETKGGSRDVYRNTIFQINFNEAINPLFVDRIKVSYRHTDAGGGITNYNYDFVDRTVTTTDMQIAISNQYRTIEIRGNIACGRNSCGNTIYCWPINDVAADPNAAGYYANKATMYKIEVAAAPLATGDCAGKNWGDEATDGSNRCYKDIGTDRVYYPQADLTGGLAGVTGLIDMAGNSFNGSFNSYKFTTTTYNGITEGQSGTGVGKSQVNPYILNAHSPFYKPVANYGDNFAWYFWLSDKIDLQAPLVSQIDPIGDEQFSDVTRPILVTFNKVMRSSTLKPGYNYGDINDKKARSTRYLLFETLTANANPVGYWVANYGEDTDADTFPNQTRADIQHSDLALYIKYGPLAGWGLESITQNCFVPSAGPADASASVCIYEGDNENTTETAGCVSDATLGDAQVKLPNPASYAKLSCKEVRGAIEINNANYYDCRVTYFDPAMGASYKPGSWIITKDDNHKTADSTGVTGCCLGVQEKNLKTCTDIGGVICAKEKFCRPDTANQKNGDWIVALKTAGSEIIDTDTDTGSKYQLRVGGVPNCCYGLCTDQ